MLSTFSEFQFYQSIRLPVATADGVHFSVQGQNEWGKEVDLRDCQLEDVSLRGLSFSTTQRVNKGGVLSIFIQFKKYRLELLGRVVRSFCRSLESERVSYAVELDEEARMGHFLEALVASFTPQKLKDCLVKSVLRGSDWNHTSSMEMIALLLSTLRDVASVKESGAFLQAALEEVIKVVGAERACISVIDDSGKQLERAAVAPADKAFEGEKFDCRAGVAGTVYSLGQGLNWDVKSDAVRFQNICDHKLDADTRSVMCYPLRNAQDEVVGVVEVANKQGGARFSAEDVGLAKILALVFSGILKDKQAPAQNAGGMALAGTGTLRHCYSIIGKSSGMGTLRNAINRAKDSQASVLIEGEWGVGKSLCARILHAEGRFGLRAFEEIDCHPKDNAFLESKLFGGGGKRSGVLFLREISGLPINLQERLVALVEGREGLRLISSTTENLEKKVKAGEFHRELYHLISEISMRIPPLRRRTEDIALLANDFLKEECRRQQVSLKSFAPKAMQQLENYDWPGNVRELKRLVERAIYYHPHDHVIAKVDLQSFAAPLANTNAQQMLFLDLPFVGDSSLPLKGRLAIVERQIILSEIKRWNGNKSKAARAMGISREALRKKMLISEQILRQLESGPPSKKVA